MKENNKRLLATILTVSMLFSPAKINNIEYKTLPPEPTKIESPVVRRLKPKKKM